MYVSSVADVEEEKEIKRRNGSLGQSVARVRPWCEGGNRGDCMREKQMLGHKFPLFNGESL